MSPQRGTASVASGTPKCLLPTGSAPSEHRHYYAATAAAFYQAADPTRSFRSALCPQRSVQGQIYNGSMRCSPNVLSLSEAYSEENIRVTVMVRVRARVWVGVEN